MNDFETVESNFEEVEEYQFNVGKGIEFDFKGADRFMERVNFILEKMAFDLEISA